MIQNIAVFCGSKSGNNPIYIEHATQLGKWLAANSIGLIYGGGSVGIMGAVANAVMNNGGKVIGVIPEVLFEWEQGHANITELRVVKDMHIRKQMMYSLCDAAIILPGGNGTMDELFEMLTWNTLKIHDKKIILLNSAGYYDSLLAHFETMQQEGFLHESWKDRLTIINNLDTLSSIFS